MTQLTKYGELFAKINYFVSIAKVFGPYKRHDGRQIVIIKDNNSVKTISYPKFLMEQYLGRVLDPDLETVDHIDGNFNNNDINNLRIVPRREHSGDDTKRVKLVKIKCSLCKKEFERSPRIIRDKANKGTRGQFCSRECAGKYVRKFYLGQIKRKFKVPSKVKSEYYKRKTVAELAEIFIKKYS